MNANYIKEKFLNDTCLTSPFHSLWCLPKLPLTEQIGEYDASSDMAFDQEWVMDYPSGHVHLRYQLDPAILYTPSDYSFRTGSSAKSRANVEFFLDFIRPYTTGKHFQSVVDVGGNDGFVASQMSSSCDRVTVIDPVCSCEDGSVIGGVHFVKQFIEEVRFGYDIPKPDLLICRHTLEHISDPLVVFTQWVEQCLDQCLFAIEVPCLDCLVESQRFDAVFHQHFHYFDFISLKHLVAESGGQYLGHTYYRQGSCGGSIIVLFQKACGKVSRPIIDLEKRIRHIEKHIKLYKHQTALISSLLKELPSPTFGYGASLMLATYAYHLNTDLREIEYILDDDPMKHQSGYKNLPVTVRHTEKNPPPPDSSFLITSLEGSRSIYKRILDFRPSRILAPCVT